MMQRKILPKKQQDLITVIVPVFNTQEYLDECLTSLIEQTYRNLEILLIDDGSVDNSPDICDKWAERDHRIQVFHQKNLGLSEARNAGVREASGSYIAYVDSDDYVYPEYIEVLHRMLSETVSANIAVCQYTQSEIGLSKKCSNREFCQTYLITADEYHHSNKAAQSVGTVVWNKLYRADLVKRHYFPPGRLHEDEFYTYRIVEDAGNVIVTEQILYYYRIRNGSIISIPLNGYEDALDAKMEKIAYYRSQYPELVIKEKMVALNLTRFYEKTLKSNCIKNSYQIRKCLREKRGEIGFTIKEIKQLNKHDFLIVLSCIIKDRFNILYNKYLK